MRLRVLALGPPVIGILLHLHEFLIGFEAQARSLSLALLVWSCLPYFIALFLIWLMRRTVIPLFGVLGPLIVDLVNHYYVVIEPASSTAVLNLLWIPLWNIVVFQPIGSAVGWFFLRVRMRRAKFSD
jgi:hypothetical protein